jgi:hypothetical protein
VILTKTAAVKNLPKLEEELKEVTDVLNKYRAKLELKEIELGKVHNKKFQILEKSKDPDAKQLLKLFEEKGVLEEKRRADIMPEIGISKQLDKVDSQLKKIIENMHGEDGARIRRMVAREKELEDLDRIGGPLDFYDVYKRQQDLENQISELEAVKAEGQSEVALSAKDYELSSPKIDKNIENGNASYVILRSGLGSKGYEWAAGTYSPFNKGIDLYGPKMQNSNILEKIEHELTHAKAYAKPDVLRRSNKNNELRSHPFSFRVDATPEAIKDLKLEKYDAYQHASEVTAYRAGGIKALGLNDLATAKWSLGESNQAILRDVTAIRQAKELIKNAKNTKEFYAQYATKNGLGEVTILKFPVKNEEGKITHYLKMDDRIPLDSSTNSLPSKEDILKYFEFLERAHKDIFMANEKDLLKIEAQMKPKK